MSLQSTVEQMIKSRKVEQAKMNDRIQLYRDMLHSLTTQPKTSFEVSELENNAVAEADASPGEKEDIELLERALEVALRVRTGSEPSKKDKLSGPRNKPGTSVVTSMHVKHSSAASKGSQTTNKSASKSASLDRNGHKKTGLSVSSSSVSYNPRPSKTTNNRNTIQNHPSSSARVVHHRASRKLQQAVSASDSSDHISASENKGVRSSVLSGNDLGDATSISTPPSKNIVPFTHTDGSGACRLLQQNGMPSEQTKKWKSLRSRQNRLWDKVVALQRKPVPGRCHFMERMRATFPTDWPCGSPDQTRGLVDKLIHQGHDLTQLSRAKAVLTKQTAETVAELGGKEIKYDSCLTLERMQLTAAEFQNSADQVKQEWKAWDRWRPEGGCLCPTGATGVWGDGITSPLPLTITYTTKAELQELERLRMRVALLQQDVYLEQALLDSLSPRLSSIVPGPGCPSPSELRDLYSLLGEGGERFPAFVLDSDPD